MINQSISPIPQWFHRADVKIFPQDQNAFVLQNEGVYDHLSLTLAQQLNAFAVQVNSTQNEMNILKTQAENVTTTASNSASVATQKASEANTSANLALTYKNQLPGYVIPAGTSYSVDQINTQNSAMTKAQFNALAEERRANRAGSGFENFGKGSSTATLNVNEGIWTDLSQANKFYLGKTTTNSGISVTNHAESMVNGVLQKFKNVNNATLAIAEILLPPAPTVYPFDATLTTEQLASGVIKHADASNRGLIVNGKFDTDTSGWVKAPNFESTAVINNGKLRVTATGASGRYLQAIPTVIGKTYIVGGEATLISGGGAAQINLTNSGGSDITVNVKTFVATTSTSYISCALTSIGAIGEFDNIAVYPADALSRSDLVMLESFHEDVAEKGFIYPLGNSQYLGGNVDGLTGIANGTFTGAETYSLFGNWQPASALIGKGYVWGSLTEAQKKAFISNPDNNCYLDGDKTIQVRYRMRVIQGLGDDWGTLTNTYSGTFRYSDSSLNSIIAKGKNVSIASELGSNTTNTYFTNIIDAFGQQEKSIGAYTARRYNGSAILEGYDNKCFALPIALVHR